MPEEIDFTMDIPIRTADAQMIKDAFAAKFGYQATVQDEQGNAVPNPITIEMFVEDCVANHLLKLTADYLVDKAIMGAVDQAITKSNTYIQNISNWLYSSNGG